MANIRRNPWYWFETSYVPAVPETPQAVGNLHEAFDRAFSGLFPSLSAPVTAPRSGFMPRLDLTGDENAYTAAVELPGVKPEDISLEVKDGNLIIQGEKKSEHKEEDKDTGYYRMERSYGSFRRVIALPEDACEETISASNKDGVLNIVIPRREKTAPESRKIEIAS